MSFDFKNAKPAELKEQYDRIAQEMGDARFFTRKELNHLPEVLMEGEQVLAFSSGIMEKKTWLIALTDKRIILLDKGMFFGLKQIFIDLDKVNAISGEAGIFFGKIIIQDGAKIHTIDNVFKKTVVRFTNKVRDAIENRKTGITQQAQENFAANEAIISQLERLVELKNQGFLNDEEFAAQKARILGN